MKKFVLSFFLLIIFFLGFTVLITPLSYAQTIVDGDLIRNPNAEGDLKYDIYIVKLVGPKKFKRLILSPHVFDSYGHLSWDNVNVVDEATMSQYATSNFVRCSDPSHGVDDPKIYRLNASGDTGSKTWINMTASKFSAVYDWDSIYIINQVDRDAYADAEEWLTYANEEHGYTVNYPSTWDHKEINHPDNNDIKTIFFSKQPQSKYASAQITTYQKTTLDERYSIIKNTYQNAPRTEIEEFVVDINGISAKLIVVDTEYLEVQRFLFFEKNNIIFNYITYDKSFYDKFISTFKFID